MFKLQEKPSALKIERPALQKMKFINCFFLFLSHFALLDPDTDPGTPHRIRIQSGYGYGSGSTTLSKT